MKPLAIPFCMLAMVATDTVAGGAANPIQVKLETNIGDILLELDQEKAPITVANFLTYVKEGFYDGTLFHRVIKDFMAQGGGYTTNYEQKPTHPPIVNEGANGLRNFRGTIAMARTSEADSATAQFFINYTDNNFLNHSNLGVGYAVFGKVIDGMETVWKMALVPTGAVGPFPSDAPKIPIVLIKASVVSE